MYPFLTGGTGFLGRRLVKALREEGLPVRCLVRGSSDIAPAADVRRSGAVARKGRRRPGDLDDVAGIRHLMDGCDTVYHVAAALGRQHRGHVPEHRHSDPPADRRRGRGECPAVRDGQLARGLRRRRAPDGEHARRDEPRSTPHRTSAIPTPTVRSSRSRSPGRPTGNGDARALPLVVIRPGVIFGEGRSILSNRVGLKLGPLLTAWGRSQTMPPTPTSRICAAALRNAGIIPGIEGEIFNVFDDGLPSGSQLLRMYRKAGQRVRSVWLPAAADRSRLERLRMVFPVVRRPASGGITRYKSDSMCGNGSGVHEPEGERNGCSGPRRSPSDEAFRRTVQHLGGAS